MKTAPIKAVLNFIGASILPTTTIIFDKELDQLFAEVEIIQHKPGLGYPLGIRRERVSLPFGSEMIDEIRKGKGE